MAKIRAVVVEGDREHGYKRVQVIFGTNSFIEITENDGRVMCLLGAHAGGIQADGSDAKGQLAQFIGELMERHPESVWKEE
jgi:metallophosphoesterase superfamily enzyme